METNKLEGRLLQRYIGYLGERDEYQKSIIYKVLANANVISFALITAFMLISLSWDLYHQQFTLGTFLLLVVQQTNSYYVLFKLKKYRVNETEIYTVEEYKERIKKLKKSSFVAGLNWGLLMFVLMEYFFPMLSKESINVGWFEIILWLTGGLFFGVAMYFIAKGQLKLETEG
ncbi:DUF3278 domain-containing protein [Metasolibacillus meyeri]|uniref:DUF3278 domain-containing protein n=1 Tax=Metasolibacillus meyeri TaxID=1071052 RepID=UPI000D326B1B|nr:DUF3278 domain-containing protein [Metasolibacillus meyeri]